MTREVRFLLPTPRCRLGPSSIEQWRIIICGIYDLWRQPALTAAFSGLLNSLLSHATLTAAFTATIVLYLLWLGLSRPCRSLCRILDSCGKRGPALSRGPTARRGRRGRAHRGPRTFVALLRPGGASDRLRTHQGVITGIPLTNLHTSTHL